MKRLLTLLLITSFLLTACGQNPSLWGIYLTPTSESISTLPLPTLTETLPPTLTATPPDTPTFTPTPTNITLPTLTQDPSQGTSRLEASLTPTFDVPSFLYYSISGDSLPALAARFNVKTAEIRSNSSLPPTSLINPGTLLVIPDRITDKTTPNIQILPDSELVFSGTAVDFDIAAYVKQANGKLNNYSEYLNSTGWTTGAGDIKRVAFENSINPRLLLAILEYESRWVRGQPTDTLHTDYPMGYENYLYKGLFTQLVWAVNQLSIAYYGWRAGTLTELHFPDGTQLRLDPRLNAGTVAIQYLFAQLHSQSQWAQIIDPNNGFPAMYMEMFGDPWARGNSVNPILPPGLTQPDLTLPFAPNVEWALTGGPHGAWEHDGSLAAIDFAPSTNHGGCEQTNDWVLAAAPGLIVRSENGTVVEDLDGDGYEQTGWDLLYLHIATLGRVPAGTFVKRDDKIGHPSCEGGIATGTHLHFARKYNGEWIAADGPIPLVLSGWTVHAGAAPYQGSMTRNGQTVIADQVGQAKSLIFRDPNE